MLTDPPDEFPVPGTPQWNAQFGRGWIAGLVTFGSGFMAGVVPTAFIVDKVEKLRWLAAGTASLGGMFAFAILYIVTNGIGFPWTTYIGDRQTRSGIFYPTTTPVAYFLVTGSMLVVAAAIIVGSALVWSHAAAVSEYLISHSSTER